MALWCLYLGCLGAVLLGVAALAAVSHRRTAVWLTGCSIVAIGVALMSSDRPPLTAGFALLLAIAVGWAYRLGRVR